MPTRVVFALCGGVLSFGLANASPPEAPRERFTDQLLIKLTHPTEVTRVERLAFVLERLRQRGFESHRLRTTATGAEVIKLGTAVPSVLLEQHLTALREEDVGIEYAEPDDIAFPAQGTYNDPIYASQWNLQDTASGINAVGAWQYTSGFGIRVAVLDTGFLNHRDFGQNLLNGYDFVSPSTNHDGDGRDGDAHDPGDYHAAGECAAYPNAAWSTWHGTKMQGIIASVANNSQYLVGAAYGSTQVHVRVLGTCGGYLSDIADGIVWASGGAVPGVPSNPTPAKILNLSIVARSLCGSTYASAIGNARSRGAVIVAAAGNDNGDAMGTAPANCSGVIAVGATDPTGARWVESESVGSNFGANVVVSAPGHQVWATTNGGAYGPGADQAVTISGTSAAAPHVSSAVALALATKPTLTPDDLAILIPGTSRPFPSPCAGCGAGIVNAGNLVNAVRPGAPAGTMSFSYGNRNSQTSMIVISNTGPGWMTGITASCESGGAITTPPPAALGPGKTMTIRANVSSSTYTCNYTVRANNATNSPFSQPLF